MATTKIRSSSIEDGQVSNADLSATIAVTGGQIADDAVTTAKILDDNVTTAKILDNNVTLAKMADGTQGDTLYYGAAGAPTLLAKPGTPADEVLTFATGATAPSWAAAGGGVNTPYFYSYLVTDVTAVSDLTWTKVPCNTVSFETGTTYDEITDFRWTPGVAGKYFIYGQVQCRADTAPKLSETRISIYKNDVDAVHTTWLADGTYRTPTISAMLDMNATDYVELWALIDTVSGNRRFYGSYQATHFMGYKLID